MPRIGALLVLLGALHGCSEGTDPLDEDPCAAGALPLSGAPDGPVVLDVGLEMQPGEGVIVVATATDPQGSENLRDVLQSVAVFPDEECRGSPIAIQDDLVASGTPETFGTVIRVAEDPELYAAIDARATWPVQVSFADLDGHRTEGRVMARIVR